MVCPSRTQDQSDNQYRDQADSPGRGWQESPDHTGVGSPELDQKDSPDLDLMNNGQDSPGPDLIDDFVVGDYGLTQKDLMNHTDD